ncbi:MAG TPA: DUF2189 domain-containing protein [Rhizomicrobium sp.]|nr:DUF2189 domain-containing protein [Rhizomicrobium sp.]HWC63195.1 DUF2189 domain-containing protein [Rhizomicrobium sp.]
MPTIKNPIEWSGAQFVSAAHAATRFHDSLHHISETIHSPMPAIRRISTRDVWQALTQGFEDFEAYRSDVIFLCATYAIVGLVIFRLAMGSDLLPLLFPLASGFAIIGPLAAVGLYEMSRRREQGAEVSWVNAFDVFSAPAFGAIAVLGLALIATFLAWLGAAWAIFHFTLGPSAPTEIGPFLESVFFTPPGLTMLVVGMGVGFWFALFAMMLSVVSFPLLVDRDVGLDTAVKTSFRAVMENPKPMALWGLLVAAILAAGTAFAFVGLMVAVPVLGHATWHLYRKLVADT